MQYSTVYDGLQMLSHGNVLLNAIITFKVYLRYLFSLTR